MNAVTVADAQHVILSAVKPQPALRIPLADAIGHVLAEDIRATLPLPPWTNASMDGFAARADDVRGASRASPRHLRVVATVPAGRRPSQALGPGEAMRLYTGAAVPDGADSVIRQEDTDLGTTTVAIYDDRDAGANVRAAGGDVARGALVLERGSVIDPHQLAVLAALAITHPMVHRRPRVGVLAMGDELVSLERPEEILSGQRLADVNGPALAALVQQAGGVPVPLGIAPDQAEALQAMVMAADDIDLLITAGGASVGDHDHVREVMTRCGVDLGVSRVRVRPGGPTMFGTFANGRPWLALPGNPVSAMVTFELFGRPAIRAMAGHRDPLRRWFTAVMRDSVRRDPVLDQYVRCTFDWPDDGSLPTASLTGAQGSGMLMSMVRAAGLAMVSHGEGMLEQGATVEAMDFSR